jgi:transcriptional regulatory protein LevR
MPNEPLKVVSKSIKLKKKKKNYICNLNDHKIVKKINSTVTKWEHKKGLFLNFSRTLYLFFIHKSEKTFSRLSGITVNNFSQIGSIIFLG